MAIKFHNLFSEVGKLFSKNNFHWFNLLNDAKYAMKVICWLWTLRLQVLKVSVLPSANSIGDTGSGYPANVYDGNRLSLPILCKTKYGAVWCMMFIDLLDGCFLWVECARNSWITIPVSEQKITLNNQVIKPWIVKQNQIEQSRTESNEWESNNW